jgi:tetratricopeptide (TPR) repeat protein
MSERRSMHDLGRAAAGCLVLLLGALVAPAAAAAAAPAATPAAKTDPPGSPPPAAAPSAIPAPAAASAPAPASAASPVPAESVPPSSIEPPPSDAPAEAHVAYANLLFQAGLYADAAAALRRAYERNPKPIYLFNAGQSYRKGLYPVEALELYERFIAIAPTHPLANEARGHVQTIQALLQKQRENEQIKLQLTEEQALAEQARKRAEAAHKKAEELSRQAEEASKQAEEASRLAEEARRKAEVERRRTEEVQQQLLLEKQKNIPLYKRKSFWAIVGVGVLGVVGVALTGSLLYERINRSDLGTIDYVAGK